MAKRKGSAVKIIPERIYDWSGGQNNAVNVALLNDNESRLLQNYSLDEKGTLFPAKGSLKRYASNLGSAAVAGMGTFYKSDKTSRLLIGLEDGKLYVDSPHLINQYDTQANFNAGQNFGVQADAGGKLWPMIITTGFEDGLFADFHTRDSGWAIDTAVFKTGAKSAKGTGTTQKLIREFGINAGQVYIKFACRFAETNQAHYPVIFKSPTDTEIQAVVADSDGHFKYHNGTALVNFPTDKTYAADTWYVVEVWVRGGTFWVSIDGQSLTPDGLAVKDTANAAQSQVAKYMSQNAGAAAATMWLDDVTISLLDPVLTRSSVAYKQDGTQVAVNQPRYEYAPLPAPVWQDTFDTDQLSQYTSGGDVAGTPTVSGGVLTYTGGTQATLIKKDLLLQDGEVVVNSDQAFDGGVISRYQDNNNYYLLTVRDDSGAVPNLAIFQRVAGTYTQLATADVTWSRGTPKQIKFSCKGSTLEAYFDGVKVISVTDTTFTGGGVGLRNNSATAFRVLDFTVYHVQQGVLMEEGNANLVKTNAGADPLFNSATGWNLANATVASSVLTLQSPDGVAVSMASCTLTNLAQNTKHSFLIRARYKDTTGTANALNLDLYASGYDNNEQQIWIADQLTTAFQNFKKDGFDSQLAPTLVYLRIFTYSTRPIEVEFVQLEQKAYATSVMDGSRAAEVLTVPTTGVFTKGNWTIKLRFTPTSVTNNNWRWLWECVIDSNNKYYIIIHLTTGKIYAGVISGGVAKEIYSDMSLQVGQTHFVAFSGNGTQIQLLINGVLISTSTYAETVGALPVNMCIGYSGLYGGNHANGILSDFAVMSKAQTLAEHQAEYNTGLPLQVDEYTTYLMSCNGNLAISATHHWISPVIDCSNATDKGSGHAALTAETPGGSTVAIASRSAPASTGPWSAWINALVDGSLQHPADNYVQVRMILTRSGENDPYVDNLTVSFDGQATASLLASDFTAGGQFYFGQLNDLLAVLNGIDSPRKYDGTTLAAMGGSPPHAAYGVAHKNRFWMAKGSRLYFSDLLNMESWPVLNFIDIMPNDGDEITGFLAFGDYLVIAKQHSIWMLLGETTSTFRVRRIHSDRGCYAPRSLCIVNQMLCFISDDGIYFSDFTQPVLISERLRATWDSLNKRRLNRVASWFSEHKLYVAVPDAGSQRNSRVLVYDTIRQAFAGDRKWPASCWVDFREAGQINTFFGRSDAGNVRKINIGYNDDGAAYEAIYESKAISHGIPEILKRYNTGYLQVKPAALDTQLIISFIVDGVESPAMTVTVPANTTGLVDTLQIFASAVGVISGHRIQIKIKQNVLDNPVGIQSVYMEALPLIISPTIRG